MMGCDIHMVLEQKLRGKWIGLHAYPYLAPKAIRVHFAEDHLTGSISGDKGNIDWLSYKVDQRNYALFGALAGVRRDSPFGHTPLGIPNDASELATYLAEEFGVDGHSHSHMLVPEFLRCYAYAQPDQEAYNKGCLANISGESVPFGELADEVLGFRYYEGEAPLSDFRIVFWFDN